MQCLDKLLLVDLLVLPGCRPSSRFTSGVRVCAVSVAGGGGAGVPLAPQLRIAEDGSVVVDVDSLTVQAQQNEVATFRRVDEGVSGDNGLEGWGPLL
jgi:hypothetical protein